MTGLVVEGRILKYLIIRFHQNQKSLLEDVFLGFEAHFYTTQTEGNVMYLAIYLQKHTIQLRWITI